MTEGHKAVLDAAVRALQATPYLNLYDAADTRVIPDTRALARAIEALATQQAVSPPEGVGWRPIETHDGGEDYVLIADAEGNVVEARLLDDGRGWWARNNDPTDHWGEEWFPTHWMPKPLPPARPHRNAADGGSSNEEVG